LNRDDGPPSSSCDGAEPSPWVERFVHLIRAQGTVLDLAAGSGRHVSLMLDLGFSVVAADRNLLPLARLRHPRLQKVEVDLESDEGWPFRDRVFDGVVVTNYLWRSLFDDIISAVAPDGVLIYETFAEGHEAYGRPHRPEFLLQPGELLARVTPRLEVVAYEHGFCDYPSARVVQRVCATGRSRRMSECPLEPAIVSS
jgi:SAM-dependent methyltransferase